MISPLSSGGGDYIYQGSNQGVFYQIDGVAPSRTLTFWWLTSTYRQGCAVLSFYAILSDAIPDAVTYYHANVYDCGGDPIQEEIVDTGYYQSYAEAYYEGTPSQFNYTYSAFQYSTQSFSFGPWDGKCLAAPVLM